MRIYEIAKRAYEKFKLLWMMEQGFTIDDLLNCLYMYAVDTDKPMLDIVDDWETARGFDDEVWPSFQEFLNAEFNEKDIRQQLMSSKEYEAYQRAETKLRNENVLLLRDYNKYIFVTMNSRGALPELAVRMISASELAKSAACDVTAAYLAREAPDKIILPGQEEYWQYVDTMLRKIMCCNVIFFGHFSELTDAVRRFVTERNIEAKGSDGTD